MNNLYEINDWVMTEDGLRDGIVSGILTHVDYDSGYIYKVRFDNDELNGEHEFFHEDELCEGEVQDWYDPEWEGYENSIDSGDIVTSIGDNVSKEGYHIFEGRKYVVKNLTSLGFVRLEGQDTSWHPNNFVENDWHDIALMKKAVAFGLDICDDCGEINFPEILTDEEKEEIYDYLTFGQHNDICDDCLLSLILDDVEEGELTANEAREILGLETVNEELEDYEYKTAGNAYFSIFPDDEHDDAVHIEIDPTWLWTNDDIDELIEQLNLAKRIPKLIPGPDFDPYETTFTEYTKWASTSVKALVELYDKLNIPSQEKEVFVVKTPYNYSEEDCTKLKEYIEKPFTNAGRNVEILILPNYIKISDI